jgi:aldehyde dehydrogenase (NAD+)
VPATSRAIVFEAVHREYVDALVDAVESLTVGDPHAEDTEMGPKVSKAELDSDREYIATGVDEGATLRCGGEAPDRAGHYIEPTVFTDVSPEMRLAQEEIFGPVLSVLAVEDFEEAIRVANGVDYGLPAAICTTRLDRAKEFARRVEAGVVKVNQTTTGGELHVPFGGRKASSSETTKELGTAGLEFFTREKSIYMTH